MCKHILNAQVSIRANCCRKWYDCAQCHAEAQDHDIKKQWEMTFGCKKCRNVFKKDMRDFDEADEYCPKCDNHFYVEAKRPEEKPQIVLAQSDDAKALKRSMQQLTGAPTEISSCR
eukprot:TRINITY_DN3216_c0_g1_i1.p1 TRINITY_DN3216_c0_g1~~TRINITY_DN3216_c0_g1_i1.p1  ORF type:complete len:116 (-),score=42.30 TRINITY_DN3216_c0_g1_i1:71-418(-)